MRDNKGRFSKSDKSNWVEWKCANCGEHKILMPCIARRRKYCLACARQHCVTAMINASRKPRGESYRKNLSESLKRKWSSGTRKANSMESRIRMGNTIRKLYASGQLVRPRLSKKTLRRIGKKVSKALKGRVTRHTPLRQSEIDAFRRMSISRPDHQPDENHFRAEVWRVRSPSNQVFQFKNLAKFVREHPELFLPEDVISIGKKQCHAYSGLSSISPRLKNNVGSWKGWTWYSHLEQSINESRDLLERNVGKPVFDK